MNKRFTLDLKNKKNRKTLIIIGFAVLAMLTMIIYFGFMNENNNDNDIQNQITEAKEPVEEENTGSIYIDINGAVNEPSVIVLPEGSRVFEAIEAAGGLTDDANLTNINRAEILEDGTYLYIPNNAEVAEESIEASNLERESGGAASSTGDKINLNTADSTTLQQLNGVGPATAEKIISYRETTGKFKKIEDLKNVSGIGEKTFEKLQPYIKV